MVTRENDKLDVSDVVLIFPVGNAEGCGFASKILTFGVLCCSRVISSAKAEGRLFTSKKAKVTVFCLSRTPPAERAENF